MFASKRMVKSIKYHNDMAAATVIQAKWRARSVARHYHAEQQKIVRLQCFARQMQAYQILHGLKEERKVAAVTVMQSKARAYHTRQKFLILKSSTILVQSLARRRAISGYLDDLKAEQRMLEIEKATKIAAVWRGFNVRSGYIFVLLGELFIIHHRSLISYVPL